MNVEANKSLAPHLQQSDLTPYYSDSGNQQNADEIDLRELVATLIRFKGSIFIVFLIFFVTSIITTLLLRPEYTAKAALEINPNSQSSIKFETLNQQEISQADEFIRTQISAIKSESVALAVADKLDLYGNPEFNGKLKQRGIRSTIGSVISAFSPEKTIDKAVLEGRIISKFKENIVVANDRRSFVVKVSYTSFDPELSARIVNAIIETYIELDDQKRFNSSSSAKNFLQSEIEGVQAKLERSERELTSYARDRGIVDLENVDNIAKLRLSELGNELASVQSQRIKAQTTFAVAKSVSIDAVPEIINQDTIKALKEQLSELNAEHDELSKLFKPAYPKMQQLSAKIQEIKINLTVEKKNILDSLEASFLRLEDEEKLLESAVSDQERKILNLKDKAVSYNILKREWETNRELYTGLLERMKEVSVSSGMERNTAAVIDAARTPLISSSPNLPLNTAIGSFLGLICGVGLAFLLNLLDRTIKSTDELEALIDLPNLGIVPKLEDVSDLSDVDLASISDPSGLCAESYRSIRTSLMFSTPGGTPKSIMITSSSGAEGKSSGAINLSIALANNGSRVLLIDADLRKPRLHKVFNVPTSPGLTEALVTLDSPKIYSVDQLDNLDFISSGVRPPNPAELLGSDRLTEFIAKMSGDYDIVIFDCSPVLGLADAVVMSARVDSVIYFVAGDDTPKEVIKRSIARLKRVNATILGTILNRVDLRDKSDPYYLYYDYKYGEGEKRT